MRHDYNHQPTIRLVNKNGDLIQMVSQSQAFHMMRRDWAFLVLTEVATIQFKYDKWLPHFLTMKKTDRRSNKLQSRMTALYGNCHVQSPSGEEIFHCNETKILWYLNRGLLNIVSTEPPTFQLKFNPQGTGHLGDEYYLTEKDNCCVVCGGTTRLTRHHVVPYVFRKNMPEFIKKHDYHDILLLCTKCHSDYEKASAIFKKQLIKEYMYQKVPNPFVEGGYVSDNGQIYNWEMGAAVKAIKTLRKHSNIPEDRKEVMQKEIESYLKKPRKEISEAELDALAAMNPWTTVDGYVHYGEFIVKKIENFQDFIIRWREHFVQTMNPQFLPDFWDLKKQIRNYD